MLDKLQITLQAAEEAAVAIVQDAEAAHADALKARADSVAIAQLDPGRLQVVVGAIRSAIHHVGAQQALNAANAKAAAAVAAAPPAPGT